MTALQNYPWPGNVRELVNVIERAISFCDGDTLAVVDFPDYVRSSRPPTARPDTRRGSTAPGGIADRGASLAAPPRPPEEMLGEGVTFKDAKERWVAAFERDYILSLLRRHGGNISHAARDADIDRKYFRKLMKKYDIEAADADDDDVAAELP